MGESSRSKVVIATATFYSGETESEKIRSGLAVDTIKKATELGYPIIVLDSGSPDDLLLSFQTAGAVIRQKKTKTYGESRRAAIKEAAHLADKEIIVWTEPEKVSFIAQISKAVLPFTDGDADIVIPQRVSFSSYPTIQQHAEELGNIYFRELTGQNLDVWFGPRVFQKQLATYFLQYDGKYGDLWDALFIPLLEMIKDGRICTSVPVDYEHPKQQTEIEEHSLVFCDKRLQQLNNLIPALRDYWEKITTTH